MVKSTSTFALLSSVLLVCSQTRAQEYADTSLAAVTAALAYVRPSPTVPTSSQTSSLATTRASGSQQPVYGQDGALPAVCIMDPHRMPGHASHHLRDPMQLVPSLAGVCNCVCHKTSSEPSLFVCQTPLLTCKLQSTTYGERGCENAVSAADRKPCGFSQTFNMTGQWSKSPSPSFHGFYNMTADCPPYAQDFDCQTPQKSGIIMAYNHPLNIPGACSWYQGTVLQSRHNIYRDVSKQATWLRRHIRRQLRIH